MLRLLRFSALTLALVSSLVPGGPGPAGASTRYQASGVLWPNPDDSQPGSWYVQTSNQPGGSLGYYYTRATHVALAGGGLRTFVSGDDLPVRCFC